MDSEIVNPNILLAGIFGAAAVIVAVFLFLLSKRKQNQVLQKAGNEAESQPAVRPRTVRQPRNQEDGPRVAGARRRQPRRRMHAAADDSGDEEPLDLFGGADEEESDKPKKIGARKQKKLEEKAMKKSMREEEEREREDRKFRQEELDEMRKQRDLQEAEKEKQLEEEEQQRKEEEERKEYEEYLMIKESFTIDDEGQEEIFTEEQSQSLLREFIDYIKKEKVVILEELGSHFNIRTQEAVTRVQELQQQGLLTGVIDDRGKFIYISQDEMEDVAKFIRQRGRVSIAELAEASNMLINLNVDQSSSETLGQVQG